MNLHKFPSKTFFVLSGCITFENIWSNSAQKPRGSSKLNAELGKKALCLWFFRIILSFQKPKHVIFTKCPREFGHGFYRDGIQKNVDQQRIPKISQNGTVLK